MEFQCSFHCISLVMSKIGFYFMFNGYFYVFLWIVCLYLFPISRILDFLSHFLKCSLCISYSNPVSTICVDNIFFWFITCLLILLLQLTAMKVFFFLIYLNQSFFPLLIAFRILVIVRKTFLRL